VTAPKETMLVVRVGQCYVSPPMKEHNPWPENAVDEPAEGLELVYIDHTGVRKYAPIKKSHPGKQETKTK
jgi:hypothetical protein